MKDRELLELAATAMQQAKHPHFANFTVVDDRSVCMELGSRRGAITSYWKPFDSGSDAFQMALWLNMTVSRGCALAPGLDLIIDDSTNDATYDTCRAIVRAAAESAKPKIHYDDLTGDDCSICGAPQFLTPSGITCSNGHSGAPAVDPFV